MLTKETERMLNAIVFITSKIEGCPISTLYSVLYLTDFEYFRQTGRSMTGQQYIATADGPKPLDLASQLESGSLPGLVDIFTVTESDTIRCRSFRDFNDDPFTLRGLAILMDMTELSLQANENARSAFDNLFGKAWRDGKGEGEVIDYNLALYDFKPEDREELLEYAEASRQRQKMLDNRSRAPASPD